MPRNTEAPRGRSLQVSLLCEACATFTILGIACSAMSVGTVYVRAGYVSQPWVISVATGFAVMIAIFITGMNGGVHANPVMTLAFAIFRRFPIWKVVPFWIAQATGAALAAALVYFLIGPAALWDYDHAERLIFSTSMVSTSPAPFGWQIPSYVALLVFGVFGITHILNDVAPKANLGAVAIGIFLCICLLTVGHGSAQPTDPNPSYLSEVMSIFIGWGMGGGRVWGGDILHLTVQAALGAIVGGGALRLLVHVIHRRYPRSVGIVPIRSRQVLTPQSASRDSIYVSDSQLPWY